MGSGANLIRSPAIAAIFAIFCLLPLAGCQIPPAGIPTAASIRGFKASGSVTMTQAFVSGLGAGSGVLTFRGGSYPFTLTGSLIGLGAISTLQSLGWGLLAPRRLSVPRRLDPGRRQPRYHRQGEWRNLAREPQRNHH